jgi:hypothetical protein
VKLKLTFQGDTVLLTAPPLGKRLSVVHEALMSGLMTMVLEDAYECWSLVEPTTVELPFDCWRHLLAQIHRGYEVRGERAEKESALAMPPVVYEVAGIEYSAQDHIPRQAESSASVGEFTLSQSKLLVIDACYHKTSSGVVVEAVPGVWAARALYRDDKWNGYSTAIFAVSHESFQGDVLNLSSYDEQPAGNAGVDSGTCGFFDFVRFPTEEKEHEYENGRFYKGVCDATESRSNSFDAERKYPADVIPGAFGVNSRTFYGDGGYDVLVKKNDHGQVVAACLVFDNAPEDDEE